MKKIIFLMATASIFSLNVLVADDDPKTKPHGMSYCAEMKGGMIKVMHEGKELTKDVTLTDGTKIMMNGTVVKKDGTTMMLKAGECINKEGKMIGMPMKEKEKKAY